MFVVSKQFHLAQEIVMSVVGRSCSVQYTYILTYIYMSSAVSRHSDSDTHNIRVSRSKRGAAALHSNASTRYCFNGAEAETRRRGKEVRSRAHMRSALL